MGRPNSEASEIRSRQGTIVMRKPLRILHVIERISRYGVPAWLLQVLRHIDRDAFQIDVLTHTPDEHVCEQEFRALGSRVMPCLSPPRPWAYARNFRRIVSENGPYDIVHSHVFSFSGFVVRLAKEAGIPRRIIHSRNAGPSAVDAHFPGRRVYEVLMSRWMRDATDLLAVSQQAGEALFGREWFTDTSRILTSSIDLSPFSRPVDAAALRAELALNPGHRVVGYVARFVGEKNHRFLVQVARELTASEADVRFLLVGDGPLLPDIQRQVAEAGLADNFVFAGERSDVPAVMKGAMDLLLFPSLCEGLGRVMVEAQAAGLPCVISDVMPEEVNVVEPLVTRLSLEETPAHWARVVRERLSAAPVMTQSEALAAVEATPFNITTNVEQLQRLYLNDVPTLQATVA